MSTANDKRFSPNINSVIPLFGYVIYGTSYEQHNKIKWNNRVFEVNCAENAFELGLGEHIRIGLRLLAIVTRRENGWPWKFVGEYLESTRLYKCPIQVDLIVKALTQRIMKCVFTLPNESIIKLIESIYSAVPLPVFRNCAKIVQVELSTVRFIKASEKFGDED